MAKKNKISAVLTDADKIAAITSIKAARAKLPFLISLNMEDRKNERKMASKSVDYVKQSLRGAQTFPLQMRGDFDTPEFAKDVNIVAQMWDIRVELMGFVEQLDDTIMAAGADAMQAADDVYNTLKVAAKNNTSVKTILDEIGKFYEGQKKPRTPKTPKA
jgi:nucleoid DNA-binding protein